MCVPFESRNEGKGGTDVVIKGRIPLLPLPHEGIDASQVTVVPARNSVRVYHALPCREHIRMREQEVCKPMHFMATLSS